MGRSMLRPYTFLEVAHQAESVIYIVSGA
jgi:hypothetical protein